jgi:hypothetical protein
VWIFPEDGILHSHRRENLKSYINIVHTDNVRNNFHFNNYNNDDCSKFNFRPVSGKINVMRVYASEVIHKNVQ